jgi:hypothetical protein
MKMGIITILTMKVIESKEEYENRSTSYDNNITMAASHFRTGNQHVEN